MSIQRGVHRVQLARVLPGNRYFETLDAAATDAAAAAAVEFYRAADGVLFVLDAQVARHAHNLAALTLFNAAADRRPIVYLVNKQDLPLTQTPTEAAAAYAIAPERCIGGAAKECAGVDAAVDELLTFVGNLVGKRERRPHGRR
ncbi:MAG: GTPase domain-containing protein [Acidobacteria bacterium]|nr:GTPase domain-containing protein [Acidobacteriota bacterium]